ncbi:MAG: hypothetical protein Q8N33_14945 [Rhodocyclaceae bacterium]|nr:hypothetical protein [Rhodocyclaceae bacterium]
MITCKTGSSRSWLVLIVGFGLGWPTAAATSATTAGSGLVLPFAFRAILRLKLGLPGVAGRRLTASPIAGRGLNLQLVQFVPFSIGTITVWYGKKLAYPAPRIKCNRGGSRRGVDFVLQWIPVQSIILNKGNLASLADKR